MTYSLNKKSLLKEKTTIIIIVFQTCVYEMSHLWDPDIPKHWWVGWSFNPGTTRTSLLSTLPPWRWHLHQGPCCSSAHVVTKKLWNNWSVWQYKWQYKFDTIGMLTVDLKKILFHIIQQNSCHCPQIFFHMCFFSRIFRHYRGHFFPLSTEHQQSQASCDLPHLLSQGKPGKGKGACKHIPPKIISHTQYAYLVGGFNPIWKMSVKMGIFPKQGWTYKIFETTNQLCIYIYLPPYIYHKKSTKCRYKYQTSILRDLTNSETDSLWDWLFVKVHPASWIRILMICFSLKVIPTNRSCIVRFWGGNLAQGILKVQGFKFSESIQLLRSVTVPWGSYRVPMDSILTDFQQ